jgi:hypothetical protein
VADAKAGTRFCATTPRRGCCARRCRCRRSRPCSAMPAEESTSVYLSATEDRLLQCVLPLPERRTAMSGLRVHQRVRRRPGRVPGVQAEHGLLRRVADLVLERFDAYCAEHGRPSSTRTPSRLGERPAGDLGPRTGRGCRMSVTSAGGCNATGHDDAYVLSDQWKAPVHSPAALPAEPPARSSVLHRGGDAGH